MFSAAVLWTLMLGAPEVDLQSRIDRAEVAVGEGRWLDAADEYAVVFDATGNLRVRYAQAEALRLGGACERAIPAYEDYLAGDPSDAMRVRTEQRVRVCREEVARKAALRDPPPSPQPPPPSDASVAEDPGTQTPPPPWYRDPLGDGLVAVGLASSIAGGVVLGLGVRENDASDEATTDSAFATSVERARTMTIAGGVTLGVGGALLVGGIVRWVVVDRRQRSFELAAFGNGLAIRGTLPTLVELTSRRR